MEKEQLLMILETKQLEIVLGCTAIVMAIYTIYVVLYKFGYIKNKRKKQNG